MLRKKGLLKVATIALGCSACFGFLALFVLPKLQRIFEKKTHQWFAQQRVELEFSALSWEGFGIRIHDVHIATRQLRANGSLLIHWHWLPGAHFGEPRSIVLDHWTIHWEKAPLPTISGANSLEKSSKEVLASAQARSLLQKFLHYDLSVEAQDLNVSIISEDKNPWLELHQFSARYDAPQKNLQFDLKSIFYRATPALKKLEGQLILEEQDNGFPLLMTAEDNEQGLWQLQGKLAANLESLDLRHKRIGLPGILKTRLPWLTPADHMQLLFKLHLEHFLDRGNLRFDLNVLSNNLHIQHPLLGEEAWGPFPLSFRTQGEWLVHTGWLKIQKGKLVILGKHGEDPIGLGFSAEKQDLSLALENDPWIVDLILPTTSCQAVWSSLPHQAFPQLEGFAFKGNLSGRLKLQLVSKDRPAVDWTSANQNFDCQLTQVPLRFARSTIRERDARAMTADDLENPSIKALLSPQYLSREQIPEDFFLGLISAEDSGFWRHEGVRLRSLQAAMQANLKAGKVLYGASTLTMQLVKNLFLHRGKVISRKLQEIFLAWVVEQSLEKEEILETYANIVEFGPNLYGLAQASRSIFDKEPSHLSRAESVYLASILPNPQRAYEENVCTGLLQKDWQQRMEKTAQGIALQIHDKLWFQAFQKELTQLHFAPPKQISTCSRELSQRPSQAPQKTF